MNDESTPARNRHDELSVQVSCTPDGLDFFVCPVLKGALQLLSKRHK